MTWKIETLNEKNGKSGKFDEKKVKDAILIEGLPGIGNVGKIAVDFLIDELKAEKVYSLHSNTMPHSVFVNEKNLLELPTIEIFYKKIGGKDVFFLAGDIQPLDEVSCYNFCESVLDLIQKHKNKEIITTGGIGLAEIPVDPKVYCTSTQKQTVDTYKKSSNVQDNLYGVVGPIMGVSGVMVGLARKRKIAGACLLAETYGHPLYVGLGGAKEIVKVLTKKLGVKVDLKKLDKGLKELNSDFAKAADLRKMNKGLALKQEKMSRDVNYIG